MCGIAAIFAYHYAAPAIDRGELRKIRDHMIARGPDGKGEWISPDRRVGLAHRRLSIIDLTEEAAQPMISPDGRLVISFNGEIYNYRALRKALEEKGHSFRTHSDTEVLLHLYDEKGEDMVHDLRGMFAFTIWDADRKALFMARDPYGIKPLYYADDGWTVRVASQVKAILAGGKVARDPEPAGIVGFFLLGSVPEPWTTWQAIRALPAGHTLWVTAMGPGQPKAYFSIAKVWHDAANQASNKHEHQQQQIREALLDSVRHHMVADVPVGAFLSAGIDSSALVALIAENASTHGCEAGSLASHPLKTITLAFEEFRGTPFDEAPLAEQVARRYGTEHYTRYVSEQEFQQDLPAILEAMDQPTIDGINTWFVAKAAQEQGLKVAISGLGGDELFGGYPSFADVPRWVRSFGLASRIPYLGDATRFLAEKLIPYMGINPKAAGMVKYGGRWTTAWFLRRGLFMPWELEQIMDKELAKKGLKRLNLEHSLAVAMQPVPPTAYAKVATLEASLYMRNQLLRDADWAGMAHSVEIRVPLVDHVLLSRLAPLLQGTRKKAKQPLAESPKQPLPLHIAERAKTGFTTPIERWQKKLNGNRGRIIDEDREGGNIPWARRWACNVAAWFCQNLV